MWLSFTAMLSLKWKAGMKESSENKRPGKKIFSPRRGGEREDREGQSSPGSLLPAEAAAARDVPSFTLAHCPLAPLGGPGPLLFTPVPLLSPCQETKCPFTRRSSLPSPGDHASLQPEVENCPSPASFLCQHWWEVAGACPPLLQAEEQHACSCASTTEPALAESLPQVGHFTPRHCALIGTWQLASMSRAQGSAVAL